MEINIRRRLHEVDNCAVNIIDRYYPGVSWRTETPIDYGDWDSYKLSVVNAISRHSIVGFVSKELISIWDSKTEWELKRYIEYRHTDRIYEEFKKTAHYINNN